MDPKPKDGNHVHYATDDSYAEKGQYTNLYVIKDADAKLIGRTFSQPDRPEKDLKIEFRPDARIWYLYLEEAECEAKERAELWRTGLDSLLIFAGLFAGIVSSFVIDARSDLEANALTSESASSRWTSGLWIISLAITLFSAIMGVLAKAWLAKFIPITTRQEAKDWHLEEVLTMIPLLVQAASLLFFVGLIIQTNNANHILGRTLIAFCIAGGIVYSTMTVLPLWTPTSPFNTPLSDLFIWSKNLTVTMLFRKSFRGGSPFDRITENEDNKALAEILYMKLLKSPKSIHVDEAIAEIASPSFREHWVGYLGQDGIPRILLERFRQFATTRTDADNRQIEILFNYMLALLLIVDYHEKMVGAEKDDMDAVHELGHILYLALQEPGSPLNRWNGLPELLRPLLFGLRAQILTLTLPAPYTGSPSLDFNPKELKERPWEMAFQQVRSSHRLPLTLAACRGLIHGQPNLQTCCASILSICVAKATFSVTETGRMSEWEGNTSQYREKVDELTVEYLSKLYKSTASGWEYLTATALNAISVVTATVPEGVEDDATHTYPTVLTSLMFVLSQPNHTLRAHATKMLKGVLSSDPELFLGVDQSLIKYVTNMALIRLANSDEKMKEPIAEAIVSSINTGLAKYEGETQTRTIEFIRNVLGSYGNPFYGSLGKVIPDVVNLAMNGTQSDIQATAIQLSRSLWYNGFSSVIQSIVDHLESGLDTQEFDKRYKALNALKELLTVDHPDTLGEIVRESLSQFFESFNPTLLEKVVNAAIRDDDSNIQQMAREALGLLARDGSHNWLLNLDVVTWLDKATAMENPWRVRFNGVLVVEIFAKQLDLDDTLLRKLIILAGTDNDDDVRTASLRLVSTLCADRELSDEDATSIKSAISNVEGSIPNESYSSIRKNWLSFLTDVSKHSFFPEIIPILLQFMNLYYDDPETNVVELLSSRFVTDPQYHEVISRSIPTDLSVSLQNATADEKWAHKVTWIKLLATMSKQPGLREATAKALGDAIHEIRADLGPIPDTPKAKSGNSEELLENPEPKSASIPEHEPDKSGNAEPTPEREPDNSAEETRDELASLPSQENGEIVQETPEDWTGMYPAEARLPKSLHALLSDTFWTGRIIWVDLISVISVYFPKDFRDVPAVVLQIAIHDPDSDVRSSCLKPLVSFAREAWAQDFIRNDLINCLDVFSVHPSWNFRLDLTRTMGLLATLGDYPDILVKLGNMARRDIDSDVRSKAIDTLAKCAESGKYQSTITRIILENHDACMGDNSWEVRLSWIKFAGGQIQDAEFFGLSKILHAAVKDTNQSIRDSAFEALQPLLKDDKFRASITARLGKIFDSSLRSPDNVDTATSALTEMTKPKSEPPVEEYSLAVEGHKIWVQIIQLLSRNELQVLPNLIEKALKDESKGAVFLTLDQLFLKVELPEPIQDILPKAILKAAQSDTNYVVVLAATLFGGLIKSANTEGRSNHDLLLGRAYDVEIMTWLADLTVKGEYNGIRTEAVDALKLAFKTSRYRDHVKTLWSKVIEASLKDKESGRARTNAVGVVRSLTDGTEPNDQLRDIVSPFISQLLKIILTDEDENLRETLKTLIYTNFTLAGPDTKLNRDVLAAIPPMVKTITTGGKIVVLRLIEILQMSDDTAASTANALMPMLKNTPSLARATAIELLSRLYSKHRDSNPRLIESAIPDVITLALDDKDNVGGSRTTAIQLLVSLSTPPNNAEKNASSVATSVLQQITPLATKFMTLLTVENLRASVAELLSVMSTNAAVRRTITLRIISMAFASVEHPSLVGHVELLSRLISDRRFEDESTDYVMLCFASAMVTRTQLARQQFKVLTALWCCYGTKTITIDPGKHKDLIIWFTSALFGRHAAHHEVTTWLSRCGLPGAPVSESVSDPDDPQDE